MIAGIAAVVKALKPQIKVIGVEPQGGFSGHSPPGLLLGRAISASNKAQQHPSLPRFRFLLLLPPLPPAGANAMAQSLVRGERVTLNKVSWGQAPTASPTM